MLNMTVYLLREILPISLIKMKVVPRFLFFFIVRINKVFYICRMFSGKCLSGTIRTPRQGVYHLRAAVSFICTWLFWPACTMAACLPGIPPPPSLIDSVPVTYDMHHLSFGNTLSSDIDSISFARRYVHRIGVEGRTDYVIPSNSFLRGNNMDGSHIRASYSAHLKYAFRYHSNTILDRIYGGAYQGIGVACFTFDRTRYIGAPFAAYLFQGARIAQLSPRLSLNYEWNFGISFGGWKPYDSVTNPANMVIGSKVNAYINASVCLEWMLSQQLDAVLGWNITHFSNGNTQIPNSGLNMTGLRMGLIYNFNRRNVAVAGTLGQPVIPPFPRHLSYDLVLFGSWRRTGLDVNGTMVASPDAYTVLGFSFQPMYNFGYKLRAGFSLDGVYDGSANLSVEDQIVQEGQKGPIPIVVDKPSLRRQMALGLSTRAEYVMPYFTVGLGMGVNVLQGGGDMNYLYQTVALKMDVTRNTFLHIGYCVKDFHKPNHLMLGFGIRFGNKRPRE
jgi:hypothetical protein